MFSIRALFAVTLYVACITALVQLGAVVVAGQKGSAAGLFAAIGIHLAAFWSILTWIHEVEQLRAGRRKWIVLFVDVTAFLMFAVQLVMACYVFGINPL